MKHTSNCQKYEHTDNYVYSHEMKNIVNEPRLCLWLGVKPVDSDKLPSTFCPRRASTSTVYRSLRAALTLIKTTQPAELMLFVFDSVHVNLHDDQEQYRTTTKLLVQTYVNKETNSLCVGNATGETVCVSKSTCIPVPTQ